MATVNGSVAVQSYFNQMFLGFGNVSGDSRDMWVWSRAGLKQRLKLRLDGGSRQLLHEPAPSSPKTKATRLSRQAKAAADWAAKANESWTRTELRDHVRLPSASETDAVLDELLQSGLIQIDPASDNSRAKHYRKVGDAR